MGKINNSFAQPRGWINVLYTDINIPVYGSNKTSIFNDVCTVFILLLVYIFMGCHFPNKNTNSPI